MIERLADAGIPVDKSCQDLGVSRRGYYRYERRPTSATHCTAFAIRAHQFPWFNSLRMSISSA